jgi:hypothetical protein
MATRTLMSTEQYDALPEKEGVKYELNGTTRTILSSRRNNTLRRAQRLSGSFILRPGSLISTSPVSVPRFVMQRKPSMTPSSFRAFLRLFP